MSKNTSSLPHTETLERLTETIQRNENNSRYIGILLSFATALQGDVEQSGGAA